MAFLRGLGPFATYFMLVGLFVCSIGMIIANSVALNDDTSDRCSVKKHSNQLQSLSHQNVVAGGFGVAAAVFAFLGACIAYMCSCFSKTSSMSSIMALIVAGVAFGVVAGLQLGYADNFDARCGQPDHNHNYNPPVLEIVGVFIAGLTLIGLVTPGLMRYFPLK